MKSIRALSGISVLIGIMVTGCSQPPEMGVIDTNHRRAFRQAAVKCLEDAAFSRSPSLRMQSLEAFGKVAPKEGNELKAIPLNIENAYPGASFAALLAAGESNSKQLIELARTRSEANDKNVRAAALFALHQFGERRRTGELAVLLLEDSDETVRANAALVLGRLKDPKMKPILRKALSREKKQKPLFQILEALAALGDEKAIARLLFVGRSAEPQEATIALTMLATANVQAAEELFWLRMSDGEFPEVRAAAVRGLAVLGKREALEPAIRYLFFNDPDRSAPNDPPQQQIDRIRGIAALSLEALADARALKPLQEAFDAVGQSDYVRVAIARAAIRTIDRMSGR